MDLSGEWLATPADDELRRTVSEPDLDTSGWSPVTVPGHWRSSAAFEASEGPLLHRRRFELAAPAPGRRWWLELEGLFYQGDVWLDGSYLGDTEGYFVPHTFEVTDVVAARTEHLLAVEVACAPQRNGSAKRNLTGVFQHWDAADTRPNPGGIWRPVTLRDTGAVRICRLRTRCTRATAERAELRLTAELDSAVAGPVTLRTRIGDADHEQEHMVAAGPNRVEWIVSVGQPRLWWPHALGAPELYDVTVEVLVAAEGGPAGVSDRRMFRTGLRQVRLRNWIVSVNGERLFLKGAVQGPTRMDLATATAAECERDVQLAVEAGLDLLRLQAHVARPETYEAADRAGLLLWQDMPMQWGYIRQVRRQAVRQAKAMVDLLAHHPSVALWCGHNEPVPVDRTARPAASSASGLRGGARAVLGQQRPSWGRSVLDRSVARALDKADGTRPVIPHSGVLPNVASLDGTDSHLWFGWAWGDERDFPAFCRTLPRAVRFVSEFGAQAVPPNDEFVGADRWPELDWERLEADHALQRDLLLRHVPVEGHLEYDSWKQATQAHQAAVVRFHVEALRRLKYRPTGGFAVSHLADSAPGITWALLDHRRMPKAAHAALVAACRPVIAVADRMPDVVAPGQALALDVHVVSDRREALHGAVTAALTWTGGGHEWHFGGDVPADACVRVGTVQFEAPNAPGPLTLTVSGTVGGEAVCARYTSRIR